MAYTPLTLKTSYGKHEARGRDPDALVIWGYKTTDAMTTVRAAGYFADAGQRSMKVGDVVNVMVLSGGVPSTLHVTAVFAITAGAADLSDGTSITLTNS